MNVKKKNNKFKEFGMALICILAVCLSGFSIYSTNHLRQTASMIYDHPYTVSNESRAMRLRLMDMKGVLLGLIDTPENKLDTVRQVLEEQYAVQYESIEVITSQYLGPKEDTAKLLTVMQDFEQTQNEALPLLLSMDREESVRYAERYLSPKYDAVNDALLTIIAFADGKVHGLEESASGTAFLAILSSIVLTLFLPAYFLFVVWRERKNIREVEYREHLFDILSSNVDEVFMIYNQGKNKLEYISANCQRVLGVQEDVIAGSQNWLANQIIEEDQAAFTEFTHQKESSARKSIDVRMRLAYGQPRWFKIRSFPELVGGKITRYIVSFYDQTEEFLREQALRDALVNAQNANTAKQNFLSRMSHEIRTPMNAIIGMTTIAGAYIDDQQRVEDCLEKIGYSSKHLMTLINDVLDMSKIDEGKMTIAQEAFNLEHVTESITSMFYPQAMEKGINFTMPLIDVTDTALIGDSLRLNQILINLLSNALKFTQAGGTVRLEIRQLRKKNGRVRLRFTVSDTGIGMSEDFMTRLFLPFEQESAATSQKYGGTGLGMSITKNLVTLMGGIISVKSKPKEGTSFTVELDFDVDGTTEKVSAHHHQALESLKVLVSDDDQDCCIHTTLLLENLGIQSNWVLTGTECVEAVLAAHKTGEEYDVCLIDWKMPDMDGIEVTRRVREFVGPDTTIIIITAYDWTSIEQSARAAGANAFLSKPVFASSLYNVLIAATGIERALEGHEHKRSNPALAGRRVLLAEDNSLNQEIAVELLKMEGIECDCVSNGQEALERFLTNGDVYDLILMDVQMPVMDGYQATRAIRQSEHSRANTIPIIAMTADAFHEDLIKASDAGMNGHLAKPIDVNRLYQIIAACFI